MENAVKPANLLPLYIDMRGKLVVLVGGGSVATRKAKNLVQTGCALRVVAPAVSETIQQLEQQQLLTVNLRDYEPADIQGAFLVIAATNSSSLNAAIESQAKAAGALVNRTDSSSSEVVVPSTLKRGNLQVAVSTSGASPSFSRMVRQQLEEALDEAYEPYVAFLEELRALALESVEDAAARRAFLLNLNHEAYLNRIRQGETLDPSAELAKAFSN